MDKKNAKPAVLPAKDKAAKPGEPPKRKLQILTPLSGLPKVKVTGPGATAALILLALLLSIFGAMAATNTPGIIGLPGTGTGSTNSPGVIAVPANPAQAKIAVQVDTNGNLLSPTNVVASREEINSGTNNTKFVTPLKLRNAIGRRIFNVKDYGAAGDGVTVDQTAIQNAINACGAAGGGTVFFPWTGTNYYLGTNFINHPQAGNATNLLRCLLYMPSGDINRDGIITITLEGEREVWLAEAYPVGKYYNAPTNFTVLRGGSVPALPWSATMVGDYYTTNNPIMSLEGYPQNRTVVHVKNLVFQTEPDPDYDAINLQFEQGIIENVFCDARNPNGYTIQPTAKANGGGNALKLPGNNNFCNSTVRHFQAIGFHGGIMFGENADIREFKIQDCIYAFKTHACNHMGFVDGGVIASSTYGIVAGNGQDPFATNGSLGQVFTMSNIEIEHSSETVASNLWMNTVYDVLDPSNVLSGVISYAMVKMNYGPTNDWRQLGGANVTANNLRRVYEYVNPCYYTNLSSHKNVQTNSATMVDIFTLTLPVGVWRIDYDIATVSTNYSPGGAKIGFAVNSGAATEIAGAYTRWSTAGVDWFNIGSSGTIDNANWKGARDFGANILEIGGGGNGKVRGHTLVQVTRAPCVIAARAANYNAVAGPCTVENGSYMIAK